MCPSLGLPAWLAERSTGTIRLMLQRLATWTAESAGALASELLGSIWGCFWPASQAAPFSHSPS